MALVPVGYANLSFLDWLANLDVLNNLWHLLEREDDVVAAVHDGEGGEDDDYESESDDDDAQDVENNMDANAEFIVEDIVAEGGAVVDDAFESDSDDGIVADASNPKEAEISKFLQRVHPMNGKFCTTKTYVAVEVVGGMEYHLCLGCFLGYQVRVDPGKHRHVDYHATTALTEGERGYCKSCKNPLYQIRRVEICMICNTNR